MVRKENKISFFPLLFSLLLLFCGVLLSAACTKKNAMGNTSSTPTDTGMATIIGSKKYLALGDSYTIGTSVSETDRYPVQTVSLLKAEGINIGLDVIATNGWTTGDLLNATKDRPVTNDYDVVSLLIGVNNQYQGRTLDEYREQFTTLIKRSIDLAGGKASHVIVISIPDWSVTPFADGRNKAEIAAEIDTFNEANKKIADNYKVNYLYITDDSRKAATDRSLIASDGLHFSGKEYSVWSYKLAPMIKSALQ